MVTWSKPYRLMAVLVNTYQLDCEVGTVDLILVERTEGDSALRFTDRIIRSTIVSECHGE
jgi:hypothetical protein